MMTPLSTGEGYIDIRENNMHRLEQKRNKFSLKPYELLGQTATEVQPHTQAST
jgi:hypothetical protein